MILHDAPRGSGAGSHQHSDLGQLLRQISQGTRVNKIECSFSPRIGDLVPHVHDADSVRTILGFVAEQRSNPLALEVAEVLRLCPDRSLVWQEVAASGLFTAGPALRAQVVSALCLSDRGVRELVVRSIESILQRPTRALIESPTEEVYPYTHTDLRNSLSTSLQLLRTELSEAMLKQLCEFTRYIGVHRVLAGHLGQAVAHQLKAQDVAASLTGREVIESLSTFLATGRARDNGAPFTKDCALIPRGSQFRRMAHQWKLRRTTEGVGMVNSYRAFAALALAEVPGQEEVVHPALQMLHRSSAAPFAARLDRFAALLCDSALTALRERKPLSLPA